MSEKYDALCLKSHCDVTRCFVQNEDHLFIIPSEISEDDVATVDLCTEASGLLIQIKRHHFFEIGKFLETSEYNSTGYLPISLLQIVFYK